MILTKDKHQIAIYLQIPHVNSNLLDVENNHRIEKGNNIYYQITQPLSDKKINKNNNKNAYL